MASSNGRQEPGAMCIRAAVVIGGASGIGKAIAVALHADGYAVTIGDRDGATPNVMNHISAMKV